MKKSCLIILLLFIPLSYVVKGQAVNHWETAVFNNDQWRYYPGTSEPPTDWRTLSFYDLLWPMGPGGIGYGDNDDNTVIPAYASVFMRTKFNVTDTSVIAKAILSMDYDDAFVAYLNDVEIGRAGISGTHPPYYQLGADHEAKMYSGGLPESFTIDKQKLKSCLLNGENVLAIQVHNVSLTSSDMSSNAFLSFGITNASNDYRTVPNWFIIEGEFSSTNLPIIIINTKPGDTIKNSTKITADMKVIFRTGLRSHVTDSGNVYTGKIGIEIADMYSASLPQKPYLFETRNLLGSKLNVSLLGMPQENDWVLLSQYNDKTFLRNVLGFEIFRKMGHYSPRSRYCEVEVNGEYQGVYVLAERIKQDASRIDIAKLKPEDISGDAVTGGYIFKNDTFTNDDSWLSPFSPLNMPGAQVYFVYEDPKPKDLTIEQKDYLKQFISNLETVLYRPYFNARGSGYSGYIDMKSFADYFLLSEVSRNINAYNHDRFFYKNKESKNGRVHSGPPWDMDRAWRDLQDDCNQFNNTDGSGWAYKINDCSVSPVAPAWELRMLQDSVFTNLVNKRYFELRKSTLSRYRIENTIDSVAGLINEAQIRHFAKWNILGIDVGTPETGTQPATYEEEITKLKDWINRRLTWLDANMVSTVVSVDDRGASKVKCRVFPNPAGNILCLESEKEISSYSLYNVMGIIVSQQNRLCDFSIQSDLSGLMPGIYIIKIVFTSGEIATARITKK